MKSDIDILNILDFQNNTHIFCNIRRDGTQFDLFYFRLNDNPQ